MSTEAGVYRVLLVDDEANVLNALRRCLSFINIDMLGGEGIQVETHTSAEQALERMESEDFDLVISDYRMPEMSGVEFLSRAIELQPHVARMILSGYADRDAILASINETQVSRFLCKPWDDGELRNLIATTLVQSRIIREALTRASSAKQTAATGRMTVASELDKLESEFPGITRIQRAEDGGIILSLDDDL
ncbi:response regulator [uncultured Aquimonas sp.]|jgi:response regulator RpfG family c-di-GMP phosphodiesterase|uniref:response regulator n=1 Tax=uncultured Aquimonas sp. TaxID=385483 RepID=UPI002629DD48|nr:response regulator [uncultured Aquimonas sp.]